MIIKRNGVVLPLFCTEMRNPGIEVDEYPQAAFLTLALSGPRITVRGDGESHSVLRCGGRVIPHYDAVSRNTVCHSRLDLESRKYSGVNTSQFFLTFWTLHRRAG